MNKGLSIVTRASAPAKGGGHAIAFGDAHKSFGYKDHYFAQFYAQLNHIIQLTIGVLNAGTAPRFVGLPRLLRLFVKDTSMALRAAAMGFGGTDLGDKASTGFALGGYGHCAAARCTYPARGGI